MQSPVFKGFLLFLCFCSKIMSSLFTKKQRINCEKRLDKYYKRCYNTDNPKGKEWTKWEQDMISIMKESLLMSLSIPNFLGTRFWKRFSFMRWPLPRLRKQSAFKPFVTVLPWKRVYIFYVFPSLFYTTLAYVNKRRNTRHTNVPGVSLFWFVFKYKGYASFWISRW